MAPKPVATTTRSAVKASPVSHSTRNPPWTRVTRRPYRMSRP